jgi:hypothetical protein
MEGVIQALAAPALARERDRRAGEERMPRSPRRGRSARAGRPGGWLFYLAVALLVLLVLAVAVGRSLRPPARPRLATASSTSVQHSARELAPLSSAICC